MSRDDSYKVLDTGTSGYLPPSAREHGVATWEWRKYEDGHEEQVLIEWHRYKEGEAPWHPDFRLATKESVHNDL